MIKKILLLGLILSQSAFAAESLNIVPELSSISFATIKKQYIIEPAVVNNIQGKYSNKTFNVSIDFNNIDTINPVRDNRLNELFFNTKLYPTVKIQGHFDIESIKSPISKTTIKANVDFYGHTKEIAIPVIIHKTEEMMTVSSYKPIIVKASDFGVPAKNLTNLAATVGGFSISEAVPLNINLTFKSRIK